MDRFPFQLTVLLLKTTTGHLSPLRSNVSAPFHTRAFPLCFSNSPASTEQAKIAFVISHLSETALEWASAGWSCLQDVSYE